MARNSASYTVAHENRAQPVVTFVIPCLNEAESLTTVIQEILGSELVKEWSCEIVVADNGSTDGSQQLAINNGARVISVLQKGYGSALMGGIRAAEGKWIVMGDADGSYSFSEAEEMIRLLDEGYDLVMGNRFEGGISPGAMPFLHKYLGNPVLSFLGRRLFKTNVRDFHCGLRAFSKSQILSIGLNSKGNVSSLAHLFHWKLLNGANSILSWKDFLK